MVRGAALIYLVSYVNTKSIVISFALIDLGFMNLSRDI